MPFLPIVARELKISSRKKWIYWSRPVVAFAAVLVMGFVLIEKGGAVSDSLGPALFTSTSVLTLIYAGLVGLFLTADCLSEEKREGTLGLLFLTDLKGYDVVLGKMAVKSITSFFGLLAVFPILALSFPMGGVTAKMFWQVCLLILVTMVLSLSIGMVSSALCRRDRFALTLALGIMAFLAVGLPLAGWIYGEVFPRSTADDRIWFYLFSPAYAWILSMEPGGLGVGNAYYWLSLSGLSALSILFLSIACGVVPRSWQDKEQRQARRSSPEADRHKRRPMLDLNPYFYRTCRTGWVRGSVWLFTAIVALCWILYMGAESSADWSYTSADEAWFVVLMPAHFFFKVWLAFSSSHYFFSDRHSGGFELLLSTPLRPKEIIAGQLLGIRRKFLWPVLLLLFVDWVYLLTEFDDERGWAVLGGFALTFAYDLVVIPWVGMCASLTSRKSNTAALKTLGWVVFFPSFVFGMLSILDGVFDFGLIDSEFSFFFGFYLLGLIHSTYLLLRSREKLTEIFDGLARSGLE